MKFCLIDKKSKSGYEESKHPGMFDITSMCFAKIFDDEDSALRHKNRITNPSYDFEIMTTNDALLFAIDHYSKNIENESMKSEPNITYIQNTTRHIRTALRRFGDNI